jgi:hypothetical protein
MPNWNENEFVERAKALARQHVASQKPINDLAEKVAREHALGPDEIRTLVRMTNVQVFQEKFAGMSDDKMVTFPTGDPELVIHNIVNNACDDKPAQSANIYNDKLAYEVPDFMESVRKGVVFDEPATEKVAAEDDGVPSPRKDELVMSMQKLAQDMDIERISKGQRWETKLAELTKLLRRAPGYGIDFATFEKDAFASFGEGVRTELETLSQDLRLKSTLADSEKVAHLQEYHVSKDSPELRLLKEAMETRIAYLKLQKGVEWLNRNTPIL